MADDRRMRVYIPVSAGELIDRITILQIKEKSIPDKTRIKLIGQERETLAAIRNCFPKLSSGIIRRLERQISKTNQILWEAEDCLRALEAKKEFNKEFAVIARRVYRANDERARLKEKINQIAGSELHEQKWFSSSGSATRRH
jgi:predicted  nucleic acid-binding Zn-ribbon protein